MIHAATALVRDYTSADEAGWLRCRVLAFLDTCYFDAVERAKPVEDDADSSIELVAVVDSTVVGLLDISVRGTLATIESVAVDPDLRRSGIATALLTTGLQRLGPTAADSLDAWTREDAEALAWYGRHGFRQTEAYLHVYSGYGRAAKMVDASGPARPVSVFAHATLEHEARLRAEYERIYVCRRMQRSLER